MPQSGGGDGTLTAPIYIDYDNDKKRDAGEPNAKVMGAVNGYYYIQNVVPGTYPVRLGLPSGYQQLKPTGGMGHWITVNQGQKVTVKPFTAWQPGGGTSAASSSMMSTGTACLMTQAACPFP